MTVTIVFCLFIASPAFAVKPKLLADDCQKCHSFQLKMIKSEGGRHATEVGCLDCHPQHLPTSGTTVYDCTECHQNQPHFEIDDCLQCHANPHRPLASLKDPLKPVRRECLSCHVQVGLEMAASPSRHAELYCNRCHDRHGKIPGCLDCHAPHAKDPPVADCRLCHSAHQPLQVEPVGYVPAGACRPCHPKQSVDLAETLTNHGGINCVYCHKGSHPSVPDCRDCHGLPHAQAIHSQHRDCLKCHGDAHRLISNR